MGLFAQCVRGQTSRGWLRHDQGVVTWLMHRATRKSSEFSRSARIFTGESKASCGQPRDHQYSCSPTGASVYDVVQYFEDPPHYALVAFAPIKVRIRLCLPGRLPVQRISMKFDIDNLHKVLSHKLVFGRYQDNITVQY